MSLIISKNDTRWRVAIPAKVRLAITLRYLTTGDSFKNLHILFNVFSESKNCTYEVYTALNEVLKDQIKVKQNCLHIIIITFEYFFIVNQIRLQLLHIGIYFIYLHKKKCF